MRTFYRSLMEEFEARIVDLRPREAYLAIRRTALDLARGGATILAQLRVPVAGNAGRRSPALLSDIHRGYSVHSRGGNEEALGIAIRVIASADVAMDQLSGIDATHLLGRVYLDMGRPTEAEECFAEEMDRAFAFSVIPAFARAVHEVSRLRSADYDLLAAEFGFRFAWDYYTARMALAGPAGRSDAPGSDLQNVGAAIRSLRALSETYVMFERGPVEADVFIERLGSPHFSLRDGSGPAFLEVRGLTTACIASIPEHQPILARMASRAMALRQNYPKISSFLLEEAEYVAELQGEAFPGALRRVLYSDRLPLRSAPFYKPTVTLGEPDFGAPFRTPETAAENASELYRYLKNADSRGRYVYRGQVVSYPGPLLPSAFRFILTAKNGARKTSIPGHMYEQYSLRKTGSVFYGEYNACFQHYANPVGHLDGSGLPAEKVNRAALLYKKIIDDPGIALAQDRSKFVPWIEALRSELSAEEYELFTENKQPWMLRISNYHRRIYRTERFAALFGYTLGHTIAQQYGFASEALDATKSLDVAFFFATRESTDFQKIPKNGIGTVYRFPFPANDVGSAPLEKYNYYTLPSMIDVKDVIYRFEMEGLSKSESRTCVDAYVGAGLIDQFRDPALLVLPEGFYGSTRVDRQDAIIILPDEVREDHEDREPNIEGIRFPKYRYIEDLASREGVQQFYFRHTGEPPAGPAPLGREDLWPRDDTLLDVVSRIILGRYRLRHRHPCRPDLIDVGFDNEEYAAQAVARYWPDRPIFFTQYEQLGARFGAVTL